MRGKQQWELSAYCPECRKSLPVLTSTKNTELDLHRKYLLKMLLDDRPVSKCKDCGAYHEDFTIIPIYANRY